MLTEIRDRSSGWFAGVIAALIIIPMAFWGIQDYSSTDADPVLLEVGDQKITQQAFQQQLGNQQAQLLQNNPSLANSDVFSSDFFKRQILDGMIDRALLNEIAVEHNYTISNQDLAAYIRENQLFQIDGEFNKEAYENYVASRSASKRQFENDVRENTRLFHVQAGYDESAIVLDDEVRELLEIQVEKRSFDIITVKQSDYTDSMTVTDADVSEYYQNNIDRFMEPQRVSVKHIELNFDDIAAAIELSESELRDIYDENSERYRSTESRITRHILLPTDGNDSEQFEKAQSLIEELNNGADFAELAKLHSQDPGSASNGGSLGEVEIGAMVPEFEEAAFALDVGAISEPVKSQFGYHIIKVDDVIGGDLQPFSEVQADIKASQQARLAQDILIERAEQLRELLFEHSDSLEGAASEMDLEVKSTTLFARDQQGEGVAQFDAVRSAAFSDQVLVKGLNSDLIEASPTQYVALQKLDYRDTEPKPLADVTEQIKAELVNERATLAAKNAGDQWLNKAESDWQSLVDDESIEIATHTVSMIDQTLKANSDVLRETFKVQLNGESVKVFSLTDSNGDFNIVRLNNIEAGDIAKAGTQVKESTRRLVSERNGNALFQSYLDGLSAELQDSINEDLL